MHAVTVIGPVTHNAFPPLYFSVISYNLMWNKTHDITKMDKNSWKVTSTNTNWTPECTKKLQGSTAMPVCRYKYPHVHSPLVV